MPLHDTIHQYFNSQGQLTQWPGKRQKNKQALILKKLSSFFEVGRRYSENEVNDILNEHHIYKDPATLRRLMYGSKLLGRTLDGKQYWRIA